MSSGRSHHVRTMRRRISHLEQRIQEAGERDLSYDKAELAALRWALTELGVELDPAPSYQRTKCEVASCFSVAVVRVELFHSDGGVDVMALCEDHETQAAGQFPDNIKLVEVLG